MAQNATIDSLPSPPSDLAGLQQWCQKVKTLLEQHNLTGAAVPLAADVPPPIGGTTANSGKFTTLEANAAFFPLGKILGSNPPLYVRDEKASGTDGGNFVQAAWQTRQLNTVTTNQITGASLAANQITLPAGTYDFWARAPAYACNRHKAKLRDTTGGADLRIGSSALSSLANLSFSDGIVMGQFTLAAVSALELQHWCTTTRNTDGFGLSTGMGDVEVYAEVMIWKLLN